MKAPYLITIILLLITIFMQLQRNERLSRQLKECRQEKAQFISAVDSAFTKIENHVRQRLQNLDPGPSDTTKAAKP